MDWYDLATYGAIFLVGLVLLQYGADVFIDNTAIVSRRLGVPETLIALLTIGAEWEEFVVVVASVIQRKPALGLGNVIGSCIGNVLGAFSLGLLAYRGPMKFDRTAKIYAAAQFVVTSFFTGLASIDNLTLSGGIFLLVAFFVYLFSIAEGVYEGFMTPPEMEVEVEDEDTESEHDEEQAVTRRSQEPSQLHITVYPSVLQCRPDENTALLNPDANYNLPPPSVQAHHQYHQSTLFHTVKLFLGVSAVTISGFVLSHSASALADVFHLSDTVVGMTILSFATTLPEKFVSVQSGMRGRPGIVAASTAGCNIFLLTLCMGIVLIDGGDGNGTAAKTILPFEVWSCWACSILLMFITFIGGRAWMGVLLLGLYGGFLGCELTVYRR